MTYFTNTTLDWENIDSGPCHPTLTVRFILLTYKNVYLVFEDILNKSN